MKLIVMCFLLSVFHAAGSVYSQKATFSMNYENISVKEVLQEIETSSDYKFLYRTDLIDLNRQVNLTATNTGIDDLLNMIFPSHDASFRFFEDNLIAITTTEINEQQNQVSGTVTDEDENPLPGVTIVIDGTTIGTTTDIDGDYSLQNVDPGAILVFSFVGYSTQRIPVEGRTEIDVTLTEEALALDEVVVVGYGTQRRINLTGAVDQISIESVQDVSVPNVSRVLQGAIPNLNISFDQGTPTANPTYNIRGLTSIGAGGDALILIDGVPGDPFTLNPDDIESVSVLKDAASAAIYGSQGAFGVVLITTKKRTEAQINYSGSYTMSVRNVTESYVKDSYTFAKMYKEVFEAWYDGNRSPTGIGASGIRFSDEYLEELKYRSENPGHGRPEVEIDPATGLYQYYGETDWYDLLYADYLPSMEHSLSISGGGDNNYFNFSGQWLTQDGLYEIDPQNFDRYNIRAKGGIQVTDWFEITSNTSFFNYGYIDPYAESWLGSDHTPQFKLVSQGTGTPMGVMHNPDGTLTQAGARGVGYLYGNSHHKTSQNQFQQDFGFNLTAIDNLLNINGDFAYQNNITSSETKSIPLPYSSGPGQIDYYGDNYLRQGESKRNYYTGNLYGDLTHDFGNHNFKILLGQNIELQSVRNTTISRNELIIEELTDFNLTTGDAISIRGGGSEWANLGTFSRINYDFKQKYLLEINARYDGSSKFPIDNQWAFFPSLSIGWRIDQENFLESFDWMDNLKIRASYGSLGNSRISPYLFIEQIRAGQSSRVIQEQLPIRLSAPAVIADDFTWETSTTINFGVDIDLFRKLSASFDLYNRKTFDMITPGLPLPAVFGASVPVGNYADLETEGFELSLRWRDQINITTKPINYNIRLTLADNVAHITKFNNPEGRLSRVHWQNYTTMNHYEGQRYGDIWGWVTEGLFVDQEDIDNHAGQSFIMSSGSNIRVPGDIKFKDLNNDGVINRGNSTLEDPGDWTIIGNQEPRYSFGASFNFDWNNFSISAFFQGIGKRDWYPGWNFTEFWGQYTLWYARIPKHTIEDAYTLDNPDPNAYFPRYKGPVVRHMRQLEPQTRYLQNAAYIRLKDLTISYSLPKQLVDRIKVTNLRFYISGYNIWTYSPIFKLTRDIDPEALSRQGNLYPMMRNFTFGVSLTL